MNKIKNIKNILLITTLSLSIMLGINIKSLAANTATIKVETANLRSSASSEATILELLSMDEKVEILEKDGDWYKVKYKSIEGYLRNDLIDVKEEVETEQKENKVEDKEEKNVEEKTEETTSEDKKEEETNKETTADDENKEENKFGNYKVKEELDIKLIPLIQAKTITTLKENDIVKVSDIKNNWAYVETETNSGWVNIGKIEYNEDVVDQEKTEEEKQEEEKEEEKTETEKETKTENETEIKTTTNTTKYVATSAANIREKASTTSDVLKSITINTEVTVLGESNGWSKVQVDGVTGYISSRLLSDTKTATSRGNETIRRDSDDDEDEEEEESSVTYSSSGSSQGEAVVAYAKEYLGCSYVYGGTSPSGFDCSGFTQFVYKHFGVSLNRTAAQQYDNGTSVSELQIGDLVMFGKKGIYHVGIYIGGGSFIHAANRERGVTIDTLTSGYYQTNYVGARRIF